MTANISFIVPMATVNLLKDPSFGHTTLTTYWTTDVGGGSGTVALDTTRQYFGVRCVKLTKGSVRAWAYQSITTAAATHTLSAYVYKDGTAVTNSDFQFLVDGAASNADSLTNVGGGWYRAVKSFSETAAAHNTGVVAAGATAIYVDGVQFEQLTSVTTFCDGDQPGCYWNAGRFSSASTRPVTTKEGGQVVKIAPVTSPSSSQVALNSMDGIGVLPVQNVGLGMGLLGGSVYQRTVPAKERHFQIAITPNRATLDLLLTYRNTLWSYLNPDATPVQQPLWVRFDNEALPLQIRAFYEGGLEFANLQGAGTQRLPIKFVSYEPYFYEEKETGAILSFNTSLASVNYIAYRTPAGTWQTLGVGLNGVPYHGVIAPDGISLYVVGGFTTAGGATAQYIAKWDGLAWSNVGSSTALNSIAYEIALAPNGDLYIVGQFTNAGGNGSADYITKWDGSTWGNLGTGGNGVALAVAVAPNGDVYVGGGFTLMGGVANTVRIARWDGSAWVAMGTGSSNNSVEALLVANDGSVYAGGSFTDMGGVSTADRIARWNGSAWEGLVTGIGAGVNDIIQLPDGRIFAVGLFSKANSIGNGAQIWNGLGWQDTGVGLDTTGGVGGYFAAVVNDVVYVGGNFTAAGGFPTSDGVALWNGSSWANIGADLPGTPIVYGVIPDKLGGVYFLFDTTGTITAPVSSTVTNSGSAKVYPKFRFTGPVQLFRLDNLTTGDSIYFNLTLLAGESAVLDLTQGNISFVSSFRGNILGAILPGSNLAQFSLLPGANSISVFGTGTTGASLCEMWWRNTYVSADGVL